MSENTRSSREDEDCVERENPTFRVRSKIKNNPKTRDKDAKFYCNDIYCDPQKQQPANSRSIDERQNFINYEIIEEHEKSSKNIRSNKINDNHHYQASQQQNRKPRSFRFIQPQSHKSALFVDLTDSTKRLDKNSIHLLSNSTSSLTRASLSTSTLKSSTSTSRVEQPCCVSPNLDSTITPVASSTSPDTVDSTLRSAFLDPPHGIEIEIAPAEDDQSVDKLQQAVESGLDSLGDFEIISPNQSQGSSLSDKMSQGCNFIHSWMSASKRRAPSVAQSANATSSSGGASSSSIDATSVNQHSKPDGKNKKDCNILFPLLSGRALSSQNVSDETNKLPSHEKTISGNHLAVSASTETICPDDPTQTGIKITKPSQTKEESLAHYNPGAYPEPSMQTIEIDIDDQISEHRNLYLDSRYHPEPLDFEELLTEADHVDDSKLEDECRDLESRIEEWERRVDDLERQRFCDDVPRTIVESVLNQRKKLRDLEFQLYRLHLDSEDSDRLSGKTSHITSPMNEEVAMISPLPNHYQQQQQLYHQQFRLNSPSSEKYQLYNQPPNYQQQQQIHLLHDDSKFGSNIKPGQENTSVILDAIPPTGSLQYKQYLRRVSGGTDFSEYSQRPSFDYQLHSHLLPSPIQHRSSRHNIHHQSQDQHVHVQANSSLQQTPPKHNPIASNTKPTSPLMGSPRSGRGSSGTGVERKKGTHVSPVRPNHFITDFWSPPQRIFSQDSSSTASSSSPH